MEKSNTEPEDIVSTGYARGLAQIAAGEYFAAHESLEEAWRAARADERDFFQGLVHVAVAWFQAGRGNRIGCERQLEKARRRLGPFRPRHRDLDVAGLVDQLEAAAERYPELPRPRLAHPGLRPPIP